MDQNPLLKCLRCVYTIFILLLFDLSNFMNKELGERYYQAVVSGNSEEATQVVDAALAAGVLPTAIYMDLLLPSQVAIGERWHRGEVTVAQEHVATSITLALMGRLRTLLKSRVKLGMRAAVTAMKGDWHVVGAHAVADFLVMDGWDVDFLGGDTPAEEAAQYIKERGTKLLCISVTVQPAIAEAKKLIHRTREEAPDVKIIVGGRALVNSVEKVDLIGADAFSKTPQEGVLTARQLCGLLSSDNALAIYLRKLGASVHEYRKLRGLSQQGLAESSGLDRAYISSVENGKQNISIGAIAKLASAMGITIEELVAR